QPHRICLEDGSPFVFAGLFERWVDPEDDIVESYTILTTEANAVLRPIHARMPVILVGDGPARWLAGPPEDLAGLLKPHSGEGFRAYTVSRHVNSPQNDDPVCIAPLDGAGGEMGEQARLF
ncbi:MAG: SOS response-associated peptidase family protein, partial [Alphaproteobacteria bacterium]|nr:SOS response-associated peptidase family protein [Alphaproteobacteria bacterium]